VDRPKPASQDSASDQQALMVSRMAEVAGEMLTGSDSDALETLRDPTTFIVARGPGLG
jgi:hypothetical protein